jgi:CRP-like cAMP-binding protein
LINQENIFQNGTVKKYEAGKKLFNVGEPITEDAVYFLKSGAVRLDIPTQSGFPLTLNLKEKDFVGIPEVYADFNRETEAVCETDLECYVWNTADFLMTVNMIWELSFYTIKSLSEFLKIINSEFIDKISIRF